MTKKQRESNIKEISNEINRIESDLEMFIDTFKNRKFKFDKIEDYQLISKADIKALVKRAKILYDGVKDFSKWFESWEKKDWHDKE